MAGRIRIGFLSGSRTVGGTESYLRDLAGAVDRARFEPVILRSPALAWFFLAAGQELAQVDVVAWEPGRVVTHSGPVRDAVATVAGRPRSVSVRATAVPLLKQLATVVNRATVSRQLAAQRLDLLHVHNGGHPGSPTALAAVLAAAKAGIPVILTVHAMAKARGALPAAERLLDRRVAAAATVTTVGLAPARALAEYRGFDLGAIRVIATGIPTPASPIEPDVARRRLGLDGQGPVVGSIAGFTPVKGHAALLAGLVRTRHELPALQAVLAGTGPCRADIERRARALGLGGSVLFPGWVDPFAVLPAFDVFVSTSTSEGLPLSILEAMSQGVPVVATAVGAVGELIEHGRTGYLVAPGDADGLALHLIELLATPTLARRLGDAGRQRFLARHRLEPMVAAFEQLYHEVLRQSR